MRALLLAALAVELIDSVTATSKPPPGPKPIPPLPQFQFSPVHGDDMVLQQQPAAAAVYGYTGLGGTAVSVTISDASNGGGSYTVKAALNTTHQPFGKGWGSKTHNPWNESLSMWKAMLKPTKAGGDYSITATCVGCAGNTTASLKRATFGDVWHCRYITCARAASAALAAADARAPLLLRK